jgi:hypothetical protein
LGFGGSEFGPAAERGGRQGAGMPEERREAAEGIEGQPE